MPHPPHHPSLEGCYTGGLNTLSAESSVFLGCVSICIKQHQLDGGRNKLNTSGDQSEFEFNTAHAMQRKENHHKFPLNLTIHVHTLSVFNWDLRLYASMFKIYSNVAKVAPLKNKSTIHVGKYTVYQSSGYYGYESTRSIHAFHNLILLLLQGLQASRHVFMFSGRSK